MSFTSCSPLLPPEKHKYTHGLVNTAHSFCIVTSELSNSTLYILNPLHYVNCALPHDIYPLQTLLHSILLCCYYTVCCNPADRHTVLVFNGIYGVFSGCVNALYLQESVWFPVYMHNDNKI